MNGSDGEDACYCTRAMPIMLNAVGCLVWDGTIYGIVQYGTVTRYHTYIQNKSDAIRLQYNTIP